MVGNILTILLWLFALAQVGMVYRRALLLFQNANASMEDWVTLTFAAVFLVGIAALVYTLGNAGVAHLTALLPPVP